MLFALLISQPIAAQSWSEFRGPNGSGHAVAQNLPAKWGESNIRWRTELSGRGWSSPVLADNQIWLTVAAETDADAALTAQRLKAATMPNLEVRSQVRLQAICLDRSTGTLLHTVDLFEIGHPPLLHSLNSFASPTPVIDGDVVYCNFGTMGTAAIRRTDGHVLWRNSELKFEHETGPGSSPILAGDLLVVNCDGVDQQFVVAFHKKDGAIAWRRERSGELHPQGMMKKAFSTPILRTTKSGSQLVSAGANWIYGYDPSSGRELWKLSYGQLGFSNVPRPLLANGNLYLSTGYTEPVLMAIRLDHGEIASEKDVLWRYRSQVPTMPTPIVVESLLFMVNDRGVATCLDAANGSEQWQKRLGGEFASSPILADGKLFFGNRSGQVFVVEPSAQYNLLATNELDGPIMATPAAFEDSIYFRTDKSLYCIGN